MVADVRNIAMVSNRSSLFSNGVVEDVMWIPQNNKKFGCRKAKEEKDDSCPGVQVLVRILLRVSNAIKITHVQLMHEISHCAF